MEEVAVTIRMSYEEAEKFKNNARQRKKTQRKYLLDMMTMYENTENNVSMSELGEEGKIRLICYLCNKLTNDNQKKEQKARVYEFLGETLLFGFLQNKCSRPAIIYKKQLERDFSIELSDEEWKKYNLVEFLNVFRENESKYYLMYEGISLVNNQTGETGLVVRRISYVPNLYDDIQKKYPYAHEEEIMNAKFATAQTFEKSDIEVRK